MRKDISEDITLCITADICNAVFPEHRDTNRWDEIISAGIRLEERLAELEDDYGNPPEITWFVRADPSMRKRFFSATFLFERFGAHLSRLVARGHEIAWHPHLDVQSLKREMNELPKIVKNVRNLFPVESVRIGEGFHSTELMRLVSKLGFAADSTALPGRFSINSGTPFDWKNAPDTPYFPDKSDYQFEDEFQESGIVEIPFTMLPIKLDGDMPGPSSRYMNLSYQAEHFSSGVMAKRKWSDVLVGIIHPAEIVPPKGTNNWHKLLSLCEEEPVENINFLLERLRSLGKKVRFRTINSAQAEIRDKYLYHADDASKHETVLASRGI